MTVCGHQGQGCLQREVRERDLLGSWMVWEADKQLVSKAAGLVCTGGIVHKICVFMNTRKVLLVGWWWGVCPLQQPPTHPLAYEGAGLNKTTTT